VRFGKGRLEPAVISVVSDRATIARAIADEIWRIGQDESTLAEGI